MKYKALICDVDGTLVPQAVGDYGLGLPSVKVQNAISKAKNSIHVGLATSRALFYTDNLLSHLSLSGPSIIQGGACIIDSSSRQTLAQTFITKDSFWKVVNVLWENNIYFAVDQPDVQHLKIDKTYIPKTVYSIFAQEMEKKIVEAIEKKLSSIKDIHVAKVPSKTKGLWGLGINHVAATKQHAILEIAKLLGIATHEIIGVGDGYNDFPLLMACGLKVAMGNAVPKLKEIADYIAPSVEENGVADVIEKFVLEAT